MKDQLAQVLAPVLGNDVVVENLRALTGGASRITSAFDAVTRSGRRALILRAAPTADGQFASMELEAAVQAAAAEARRKEKTALLRKKTRRGQPVMKYRMEGILSKLAAESAMSGGRR